MNIRRIRAIVPDAKKSALLSAFKAYY